MQSVVDKKETELNNAKELEKQNRLKIEELQAELKNVSFYIFTAQS